MIEPALRPFGSEAVEDLLRDELAHGERLRGGTGLVLRHLIGQEDRSLFSEEVVSRVRAMLRDVARQLLAALGEPGPDGAPPSPDEGGIEVLVLGFVETPALLAHAHALALEFQVGQRLLADLALDPVLSPLVQSRIASADPDIAAAAMALLAAQARFGQAARRMELPLGQLPPDLYHLALLALRAHAGVDPRLDARAAEAEQALRQAYDGAATRFALLSRVLGAMGGEAIAALDLHDAGLALFLTALAHGTGQDRDEAVLSVGESQVGRLLLSLAACGLKGEVVAKQLLALHPELEIPEGMVSIHPDRAAAILAQGLSQGLMPAPAGADR